MSISLKECQIAPTHQARNEFIIYTIGFVVMALIVFMAVLLFQSHGIHIEHYQAPATWAMGASGPQATPVVP